jgi:hypothetical protein
MPFGERYIWGITAGIVRNLYDRVYGQNDQVGNLFSSGGPKPG